jgi:hypothetical protein
MRFGLGYRTAGALRRLQSGLGAVLVFTLAITASPRAEATDQNTGLALELNQLEPSERGCRATFVIGNRLGARVDALAFELALFDADGAVSGLITLDAGSLPNDKTRVKRFALPGVDCERVGRVLLNDVSQCDGKGLTPAVCLDRMAVSSRALPGFGL